MTQQCCEQYWTSPGDSTSQSSSYTATYHPSRKLSKLDEPDTRDTAGEVRTSSYVMYSVGPLHMDEQRQDVQLEPTYSSCVDTGCSPEDLPKAMDDMSVRRDRVRNIRANGVTWWWGWGIFLRPYFHCLLHLWLRMINFRRPNIEWVRRRR